MQNYCFKSYAYCSLVGMRSWIQSTSVFEINGCWTSNSQILLLFLDIYLLIQRKLLIVVKFMGLLMLPAKLWVHVFMQSFLRKMVYHLLLLLENRELHLRSKFFLYLDWNLQLPKFWPNYWLVLQNHLEKISLLMPNVTGQTSTLIPKRMKYLSKLLEHFWRRW